MKRRGEMDVDDKKRPGIIYIVQPAPPPFLCINYLVSFSFLPFLLDGSMVN